MERINIDEVRKRFPEAKTTIDGGIQFNCPICEEEGRPNIEFTIFGNGATSCRHGARGGKDYNREHCAPVRESLALANSLSPFIEKSLFDNTLTLELAPSGRNVRLTARNCANILALNIISLDKSKDRREFISSLPGFNEIQRAEIDQALINLADEYNRVCESISFDSEIETTKSVIFQELPDGRLIEQIHNGLFAVYNGASIEYSTRVECDNVTYLPIKGDPCIEDNDIHLPDHLTEYDKEEYLDQEIETYLATFCDAPVRELKYAAKLIRLTYIQDRLNEVPYLHIVGPSGSGKTRMSDVVGMACHRPFLLVDGTASFAFRISEKFSATLCFDEFNPKVDSDDTHALMQILNAGFQRRRKVPRTEKINGEFVARMFSPFGVKIFSGLKITDSYAFQRRTIQIQLSVTLNKNIPFCDDGRIDELSAPLREKLTLWRLRNWKEDYRSLTKKTESIFKSKDILPGYVQTGVPLAMLIKDIGLQNEFMASMESRTSDAKEEKRESLDGRIVSLVHSRLFDVEEGQAHWKIKGDLPLLEEGKPCEQMRVAFFVDCLNDGIPDKKKIDGSTFTRRRLKPLGFQTKQLTAGAYKGQTAIVFNKLIFQRLFNSFSLSLPGDFASTASTPHLNEDSKEFVESRQDRTQNLASTLEVESPQQVNLGVEAVEAKTGKVEGESFFDVQDPILEETLEFVALDTETEPFDKKRGIGPRNAAMVGLALSFDGLENTSYSTDRDAWSLLMPEPEQTVIFHNAKFDLAVLERSGLSRPTKWEDTLIAAHLLNETGEHGLKPLAKKYLEIEEPITFQEADQMRLLNPEIFNEYASNDARYTYRLWPIFEKELIRQDLIEVYNLEKALLPVTMEMESAGMRLDLAQISEMRKLVKAESKALENEIYELAGCKFDLRSPQKVAAILFDKLQIPSNKKTVRGQRSVSHEALDDVRGHHPVVNAILEYREIDKLATTFLQTLPKFADKNGRIHPEFKQLGATSGRFSCADPNVQQIPSRSELGKKLRQMFIAEEGNVLVVADWSQMELRILAQYSKDPLLISAYTAETETDLHSLTAARIFGKSEDTVTKIERSVAKMINFGIAYGITAKGLFNRLRPQGIDVTYEQCEQFVSDYFKTYKGVRSFLNKVQPRLYEFGFVRNWFGRRRRVSGTTGREVRQAQNFIIQSTAADMAKTAMIKLHKLLPVGSRLIAMIHDEFIVECRKDLAIDIQSLMAETMQTTPEGFTVPMLVEVNAGDSWGDAK